MKLTVSFKTPDTVDYAIQDALKYDDVGDSALDFDTLAEKRAVKREELQAVCDKFVSYGECVTIEFDTETKTATVIEKPRGRY